MNEKYTPNLNNPRVLARVKLALEFIESRTSQKHDQPISQAKLTKHFGQLQGNLAKWLKETLLIQTESWYSIEQGICQRYMRRQVGYLWLKKQYTKDDPVLERAHVVSSIAAAELEHREDFQRLVKGELEYTLKSNRYWHPLQNLPKVTKQTILAQYSFVHQYDTECAAPTLLYQRAQQTGMDEYLFGISRYIADRDSCRKEVMLATGLDKNQVKQLINSLFCGARISCNFRHDIFKLVGCSSSKIKAILECDFITLLRADICKMWAHLVSVGEIRRNTKINPKTGKQQFVPARSKQKWAYYFKQEMAVLDLAASYLKDNHTKCFLEHDGWTTQDYINPDDIIDFIKSRSGFKIKLDYLKINLVDDLVTTTKTTPDIKSVVDDVLNKGLFHKPLAALASNDLGSGLVNQCHIKSPVRKNSRKVNKLPQLPIVYANSRHQTCYQSNRSRKVNKLPQLPIVYANSRRKLCDQSNSPVT